MIEYDSLCSVTPHLYIWKVCCDEKSTLAFDKVSYDLDNILSLEMLSCVSAEDEVIAGVEDIRHNVMGLKCPGPVIESFLVVVDVGFDNIEARENYV